ncbi:uncharacterized protein WM277_024338 isoform 2-T2 [Molossus nigricans]
MEPAAHGLDPRWRRLWAPGKRGASTPPAPGGCGAAGLPRQGISDSPLRDKHRHQPGTGLRPQSCQSLQLSIRGSFQGRSHRSALWGAEQQGKCSIQTQGGVLGLPWVLLAGTEGPEEGHGASARLGAPTLEPGAQGCCPETGHRVKEACGETTGTVCAPCSPGTYTAHRNSLDECLPCHLCDPDRGLVTRRKCSSTGNTVCGCDRGYFCVLVDGDNCAECWPHRDCRPGQRVQVTGTERQDTLCEDCPPGTFSAGGTQAVCEPWSKCSGLLEMEAKPGTNSTDVTCSSSFNVAILCVCTVIPVIPVPVSLGYLIIRIRRSRGLWSCQTSAPGPWRRRIRIPARDPPADECFRVQTSERPRGLLTAPGPRGTNVGPAEPLGPPATAQRVLGTTHVTSSKSCGALSPCHPLLTQHTEVTPTGNLERGRERNMHEREHQLAASCMPPTRDLAHDLGMCPDRDSKGDLPVQDGHLIM